MLRQVFLDEPGTDVHVELHERRVADAAEAVNLAGLDHEDVAGAGLELLAVHRPQAAPLPDELHLIVRMTMRSGTTTGQRAEKEDRDVDVAMIGADELMRASLKRQVLLTGSMHCSDAPVLAASLPHNRWRSLCPEAAKKSTPTSRNVKRSTSRRATKSAVSRRTRLSGEPGRPSTRCMAEVRNRAAAATASPRITNR